MAGQEASSGRLWGKQSVDPLCNYYPSSKVGDSRAKLSKVRKAISKLKQVFLTARTCFEQFCSTREQNNFVARRFEQGHSFHQAHGQGHFERRCVAANFEQGMSYSALGHRNRESMFGPKPPVTNLLYTKPATHVTTASSFCAFRFVVLAWLNEVSCNKSFWRRQF